MTTGGSGQVSHDGGSLKLMWKYLAYYSLAIFSTDAQLLGCKIWELPVLVSVACSKITCSKVDNRKRTSNSEFVHRVQSKRFRGPKNHLPINKTSSTQHPVEASDPHQCVFTLNRTFIGLG